MKKLLCFLLLAFVAGPLQANNMKSASFYLNAPEKYEDKKIIVYVAYVSRRGSIESRDGVLYYAYTMSRDDRDTSFINVLVPTDKAESFARRYDQIFSTREATFENLVCLASSEMLMTLGSLNMEIKRPARSRKQEAGSRK